MTNQPLRIALGAAMLAALAACATPVVVEPVYGGEPIQTINPERHPSLRAAQDFSRAAYDRLSAAQACTLIAFPAMGSVLYSTGTPLSVIFELLGGCGGIGATACAAACGGRRLIVMLSEAALRAAASK